MTALRWEVGEPPESFVDFCAGALPEVYGYLLARSGDPATAEDLTSATFEAAVSAVRRATVTGFSVARFCCHQLAGVSAVSFADA